MFELWSESRKRLYPPFDETPRIFESYLEAQQFVIDCLTAYGEAPGWKPRKIKSITTWQEREARRLIDGTYKPVPLAEYNGLWRRVVAENPEHFVHCSRKQIGKLAYTESPKKGDGDMQTPITLADYLARFGGVLSDDEKRDLLNLWVTLYDSAELKFARTTDEILDFMWREDIPGSCMSGRRNGSRQFSRDGNPYRVYGDESDIAVAYLEKGDGVCIARCLAWEAKKIHGRLYGAESALAAALREIGFAKRSLAGAKIKMIERDRGGYVMPYLDSPAQQVRECGDHFKIAESGDYICDTTTGYIIGDDDSPDYTCDRCDDGCDETYTVYIGRRLTQGWCEYCRDNNTFFCEGTNEYYSDDVGNTEVDGNTYCDWYVEENFSWCEHTEKYVNDDVREVIINTSGDTEQWCDEAISDDAFQCRVDHKLYHNSLLSPMMTEQERDDDAFICRLNDERCFEFHNVPEQTVLPLEIAA